MSQFSSLLKVVGSVAVPFMAATVFSTHFVVPTVVVGQSMAPTLNPDPDARLPDLLLLERIPPADVRVGDIVCISAPYDPNVTLVKRVLGIAGDVVHSRLRSGTAISGTVPANRVWLEGDNGPASQDSRDFGSTYAHLVLGAARAVIFPPTHMKLLPRGTGPSLRERAEADAIEAARAGQMSEEERLAAFDWATYEAAGKNK